MLQTKYKGGVSTSFLNVSRFGLVFKTLLKHVYLKGGTTSGIFQTMLEATSGIAFAAKM